MGLEAILVLCVLAGAIALFVSEKLSVDLIAMLVLATLLVLGLFVPGRILSPAEAVSGFSSQATIAVAAMFVLSAALQRTGAMRAIGRLFARIRQQWLFVLVLMLTLVGLGAFVNNTAAMAVFLPMVLAIAASNGFSASKVLIPMSYAAQMGGVCTLIGTSTNLLVHSMAQAVGLPGFDFFEFTSLGLITAAVGISYVMLVGPWLLPSRRTAELTQTYDLGKYITELHVTSDSKLVGQTVTEARLGETYNVSVLELLRGERKVWAPKQTRVEAGDILLVRGHWDKVSELRDKARLEHEPEFVLHDQQFEDADQVLAEVMIAPGSRLHGRALADVDAGWYRRATILALHRRSEVLREQLKTVTLEVGDVLLALVPKAEVAALRGDRSVIVLSEKEPDSGTGKAWIATGIMVAVVGAAALDWLPIMAAAIVGCIALVLTRCLKPEEAYEAIDWRVIMLLAGLLPLGIAMQNTGAAAWMAEHAVALVGDFGPVAALAAIYAITALMTEAMSNNASAVLMTPIAIATAQGLDSNPTAFLVAVAFAASTSFATPVGYQTNTMIYSAGGYRFTDFVRIGVPLNVLFWLVAVMFIPRFWPL
ncbi:SLC13 family permease [Coralloluteibacterium stylophorae]|uniref:SLC13 family permease n=1 Tax=Coralloluteibacterium stylophorae TaxID=1776034 RepID=A0A8J8AXB5_9GAMM|nr:SLC13 family permease [Coralloluteibacterium stylophorae]MBS7458825.1 SLC13 family permease [Coralloluteibacterium stylophorae]